MRQIAKVFQEDIVNRVASNTIEEQINRYLRTHQDQTVQSASYVYDHTSPSRLIREALVIFNKGNQ